MPPTETPPGSQGTPNTPADGGNAGEPGPIPYARFDAVNRRLRDALGKIDALEGQLAESTARLGTVDALTGRVKELETTLESERGQWGTERSLMEAGLLDPEARDLALFYYGRQPEDGRPALGDWLKAAKEDPAKAPKGLQAYLQPATPQQPPDGAAPPATPAPEPTPQGGQRPPAAPLPNTQGGAGGGRLPAQGTFTAEQIRAMTPEQFKANKDAILGQIRTQG